MGVVVRKAQASDIVALCALEERVWRARGAPVLGHHELKSWYQERSPYFLVAENADGICGYYFARQMDFAPEECERFLAGFSASCAQVSDPKGDSVCAVSLAATVPGAGSALAFALREQLIARGARYFAGFSRLPLLDRTATRVEAAHGGSLPCSRTTFALWYAHESLERIGLTPWSSCPPKPRLSLPKLSRADPVLAFHLRGLDGSLLRVIADYMPDPESRGFAALVAARITLR